MASIKWYDGTQWIVVGDTGKSRVEEGDVPEFLEDKIKAGDGIDLNQIVGNFDNKVIYIGGKPATDVQLGMVKVGDGLLSSEDGSISVIPSPELGKVKVDPTDGVFDYIDDKIQFTSSFKRDIVSTGPPLNNKTLLVSGTPATSTQLGMVKVGGGLSAATDGTISADGYTYIYTSNTTISAETNRCYVIDGARPTSPVTVTMPTTINPGNKVMVILNSPGSCRVRFNEGQVFYHGHSGWVMDVDATPGRFNVGPFDSSYWVRTGPIGSIIEILCVSENTFILYPRTHMYSIDQNSSAAVDKMMIHIDLRLKAVVEGYTDNEIIGTASPQDILVHNGEYAYFHITPTYAGTFPAFWGGTSRWYGASESHRTNIMYGGEQYIGVRGYVGTQEGSYVYIFVGGLEVVT